MTVLSSVPATATPRRLGVLAAGLIAAVLFLTGVGRAAAAPPEVLASENPVIIPLNQNTKGITLSWNLGNVAPKATLSVKDNAQVTVLSQTISTQTGSTPFTVTYGKSYTAQLYQSNNPDQPLGSPLTITTKRPAANQGAGCNGDLCVNSVTFTPRGQYAPFTVKTNKPAHFVMEASTEAPLANLTFTHVDRATFNLSNVTQWDSSLLTLNENTKYYYILKATDAAGQSVKVTGSFQTLRRRVTVEFTSLHMIEDSDVLSACDCNFWFQVGSLDPVGSSFLYVNSGETIDPNIATVAYPTSDSLRVRVNAVDDDRDPLIDFCSNGWGPFWSNGSTNCLDWSYVSKYVDVELAANQDSKQNSYSMTADDGPVKFTVFFKVTVDYVK